MPSHHCQTRCLRGTAGPQVPFWLLLHFMQAHDKVSLLQLYVFHACPPYSLLHPLMDSIWGSFQYLCPSETIGPLYMALIPVVWNVILETSLAYTDTPCLPSAHTPVFTAGSCVLVMRQEVIITGDCTLRRPHSGVRRPP